MYVITEPGNQKEAELRTRENTHEILNDSYIQVNKKHNQSQGLRDKHKIHAGITLCLLLRTKAQIFHWDS